MRQARYAFNNWFSRVYLLAVLAVAGWALYTITAGPGPSFAGIWPVLVTMPVSLLGVAASSAVALLGADSLASRVLLGVGIALGVALGAMVNATMIGMLVHLIRRRLAGKPA